MLAGTQLLIWSSYIPVIITGCSDLDIFHERRKDFQKTKNSISKFNLALHCWNVSYSAKCNFRFSISPGYQVQEIKTLYSEGYSGDEISKEVKLSRATVFRIIKRLRDNGELEELIV